MKTLTICLLATAAAAMAQESPLSAFNKRSYGQVKSWLLASAEKMPEESYAFQPADTVRTFGQLLGHVSDAQYLFCASVRGEKSPVAKIEGAKITKAELIEALKEAFVYCDKAYSEMTDAKAVETVKLFGATRPS